MAAFLTAIARSDGPVVTGYPAPFSGQVDACLTAWNLNMDFTGACMIGIMAAMDEEATLALPIVGGAPRGDALQIADGTGGDIDEGGVLAAAASPERSFLMQCMGCRDKGLTWLLDLVIAEQHKKMKPENVASYYMMQTHKRVNGATILKLIEPAASLIANIRATNAAVIPDSIWMRYRTSATSTPNLIKRVIDIWGNSVPGLIGAGTMAAVDNAALAPWNVNLVHNLPDRIILLTHATLVAFRMLPDDWYYGATVLQRSNASVYNGYLEAAKKIREFGGNALAIRAAADITALNAAIPASLTGI